MGTSDNIRWYEGGWDDFERAIESSDIDAIRGFAKDDPGIVHRVSCEWGECPIHEAIRVRSFGVVDVLLELGADINAHCEPMIGWTPLDIPVMDSDREMAQYLLDRGANPNIPTWMWGTAIGRAAWEAKHSNSPSKQDEWIALYEIMLSAAKKFGPPKYPDGTVPEFWPPTLEDPNPKRVPPQAQDREP